MDSSRTGRLDTLSVDEECLTVVETTTPDDTHEHLPVAVTPAPPPPAGAITAFLRQLAEDCLTHDALPTSAATDVLRRSPSRLVGGAPLTRTGDDLHDITRSLLEMEDSYVAVQGPRVRARPTPARASSPSSSGNTGDRRRRRLVPRRRGEPLAGGRRGRVPAERVGKSKPHRELDATFSEIKDNGRDRSRLRLDAPGRGECARWHGLDLFVPGTARRRRLRSRRRRRGRTVRAAPTLAVSLVARRLLLLGDPRQLPQVSQGTHPEPVDTSALGGCWASTTPCRRRTATSWRRRSHASVGLSRGVAPLLRGTGSTLTHNHPASDDRLRAGHPRASGRAPGQPHRVGGRGVRDPGRDSAPSRGGTVVLLGRCGTTAPDCRVRSSSWRRSTRR